jgi:hypothetical protein
VRAVCAKRLIVPASRAGVLPDASPGGIDGGLQSGDARAQLAVPSRRCCAHPRRRTHPTAYSVSLSIRDPPIRAEAESGRLPREDIKPASRHAPTSVIRGALPSPAAKPTTRAVSHPYTT